MSDLISRQAAIKEIVSMTTISRNQIQNLCNASVADAEGFIGGINEAIKALENLPSAEPERKTFHVIDRQTGREADPYDIALNEDWAKGLMYCDMEGFALLEDGTLILTDECGRYEFPPDSDRFEIVWDCGAEMKK